MLIKDTLDQPWGQNAQVDPAEIARFEAYAEEWWKPDGKFKTVHEFNRARWGHVQAQIDQHFHCPEDGSAPLEGLRVLDVGCGAGLLSEPLATAGANVVGIDATARNIEVARRHASQSGVDVDYRHCLAEHVLADQEMFDVVLNMEVIEHVAEPAALMAVCCQLVRPGGLMMVATLNRTLRSFVVAIVGAEYVLRWLPIGTHQWRRFQRPQEISAMIEPHGLDVTNTVGLSFSPFGAKWVLSQDCGVNYLLCAAKQTD